MEKWFVATKKADFDKIAADFEISPFLARIIRNRDVETEEEIQKYLYGTVEDLYDPMLLKDMDKGVDKIAEAIREKKKIRIIGDYDVDGICASQIFRVGLEAAGADVDVAIPNRMTDGYGLNEHLIRSACEDGKQFIVTCDNGIAAKEQIELAYELGLEVLVTDHHEVPYEEENGVKKEILPKAAGVIDPKRAECEYPFPEICGAVVALKVIQALSAKMESLKELLPELISYAALATVCDVMELKDENRIIVKEGLARIHENPPAGLLALMMVNGLEKQQITTYHLGFVIGPCMNAAGRLDTAMRVLNLLSCSDLKEAMPLAAELKDLNDSRKDMTSKGVERANRLLKEKNMLEDKVFVVYIPECHESLAGIIAGRLKEQFYRPVFVITDSEDGVKGSGRSIEGYNMYQEMVRCKECFTKFGGHKMAAGFSMEKETVSLFRKKINENCRLKEEDFIRKVHIDIPLPLSYAGFKLATELERLEPYGVANQKPLFAQKNVIFVYGREMGKSGKAARFEVFDERQERKELVYFGELEEFYSFLKEKFGTDSVEQLHRGKGNYPVSITYQLGINCFRGEKKAQIVMQNYM